MAGTAHIRRAGKIAFQRSICGTFAGTVCPPTLMAHRRVIHVDELSCNAGDSVLLGRSCRLAAEAKPQCRVIRQPSEQHSECTDISWRTEQSIDLMRNDLS